LLGSSLGDIDGDVLGALDALGEEDGFGLADGGSEGDDDGSWLVVGR
jgi:hypothetical protein